MHCHRPRIDRRHRPHPAPPARRGVRADPRHGIASGGAHLVVVDDPLHQRDAGQSRGEVRRRARKYPLDRAGLGGAAGVDDDDIVRQRPQVHRIVGHQDHGPAGDPIGEQTTDRRSDLHVQRGQRLVQQHEFRVHGQRAGERHTLGLPSGQFVRAAAGEVCAAHGVELGAGAGESVAPAHTAGAGAVRHVLQGRDVRQQTGPLLERDDPAAVRRHVGAGRADDAAVEADLARVGA